ncbi:Protein CBG23334 [Caenorhabditis briggsae]|uniref:Protein CBG23334 n=1 Tax=Caenorhabditis briggsae TaxID=6238 RepID=A8Y459_CAEBR|nr:Protein CBG23334 [Caenorhabditis briggsae]CAP39679.2 Protein CBG23334 [Caenorhabditis briggsae]
MITRCILNIRLNTIRRGICTSRPSSSVFQKIKHFLLAEERDNFDADNIRKAHEKDKVDEKEWALIYRDVGQLYYKDLSCDRDKDLSCDRDKDLSFDRDKDLSCDREIPMAAALGRCRVDSSRHLSTFVDRNRQKSTLSRCVRKPGRKTRPGASRTFYMTAAFLPCFIIGSTIFAVDINTNSPSNRFDFVQKLVTDAEELGSLIVLPSLALTVVIAFLARVQQLRLIRIYQNKKDTESFMAIQSKLLVTQHKALFRRDETAGFYFADDQTDGARVALHFLFGNIQIGNRKFMIMDDMFKANNYRSYMLNETSVPPRL